MQKLINSILFATFLGLVLSSKLYSQENPRNTGLKAPQKESLLPVSKAEIVMPSRKTKVNQKTELVEKGDNTFVITNGWELLEAEKTVNDGAQLSLGQVSTAKWYNATVPGTVLTTLVNQGVYPDPYFGLNNLAIPDDLAKKDWWYINSFKRPKTGKNQKVWLQLNGINYEANVWLNGKKLGNIKGAFIRGEFDVTEVIETKNTLAIHIIPPPNPGIGHEASARTPQGPNGGAMAQDGPTFISSEGWDWVPTIRDRNIGIWQDIQLKVTGGSKIVDPMVVTDLNLPETSQADLTIKTTIESDKAGKFFLLGEIGDLNFSKSISLAEGKNEIILAAKEHKELQIKNPKLWWPNGYGEQNLHYLKLTLLDAEKQKMDEQSVRFGIREMSYEFAVASGDVDFQRIDFNPVEAHSTNKAALFDNINRKKYKNSIMLPTLHEGVELDMFTKLEGDNPYLVFKVNGIPIFCKGGNWGMDDAMKRVSRDRLEPYFKLHKDANYTMIRNWTGESTEEVFYELADEYGMLVWNDFWMSTEGYNMPPADYDLFMENATDVVKRFRNHPSIALWCARNEGYAPAGLDKPLADLIAMEDGTRMYQSNSRYLNLRPSGPWNHRTNINYYFIERADGFSTEVGTNSFPTAETFKTMVPEEDLWPINDVWYYHDLHMGQAYYRANMIELFGEPFTVEDFSNKAQWLNYRNHRAIFEAWNSKLWDDASGVLLWMTHPAWPSMIWQTYSWDYETYGAYYGAKKACEPIHIQLNDHDNKVLAINTTLHDVVDAKVILKVYDLEGNELFSDEKEVNSTANSKTECMIYKREGSYPSPHFIRLSLHNSKGEILSQNTYWRSYEWINKYFKLNDLEKAEISADVSMIKSSKLVKGKLTVRNSGKEIALNLKFNIRNSKTNERILPAYFSDGYFELLPEEEREIVFECDQELLPNSYVITVDGYNVDRTHIAEMKKIK